MSRIGSPASRRLIASLTWWGVSFGGRPSWGHHTICTKSYAKPFRRSRRAFHIRSFAQGIALDVDPGDSPFKVLFHNRVERQTVCESPGRGRSEDGQMLEFELVGQFTSRGGGPAASRLVRWAICRRFSMLRSPIPLMASIWFAISFSAFGAVRPAYFDNPPDPATFGASAATALRTKPSSVTGSCSSCRVPLSPRTPTIST